MCAKVEARLYVCETCARDVTIACGERTHGQQLSDAVGERLKVLGLAPGIVHRTVLCLNGCPRPCNVALRAPGKCSLRLGQLTPADAESIIDFLLEYSASPDGNVPPQSWPAALRDKVTARTPPLGATGTPSSEATRRVARNGRKQDGKHAVHQRSDL